MDRRTSSADRAALPVFLGLFLLVLAVYWQVGGDAFVNIDDGLYVTDNPMVLRGVTSEGVSWAFSTFHAANWHPLTWLSHMLDVTLFGPSPGWHHRVNVLLHLLNTELLFFVLWGMTGGLWQSAFVAALFGVHPLHVESVAWVAERKDVLSTFFWISTMGAYLRYVRRPGAGRYAAVMVLFALGLMSKPMLVTLPFVLLLLDVWPLARLAQEGPAKPRPAQPPGATLQRLVLEKVPLLLMSAASCAVTYVAQARSATVSSLDNLPFASRIANASASSVTYLWQTLWPSGLAVFYPHPETMSAALPAWRIAGSILLLCALSLLALRQARRRPFLAAGWFWYLGTLVPVIGLVQVGAQAHADRYTYLPLIGIFVAVAWGVPALVPERRFRRLALGTAAGVTLAALSAAAWVQAGYWRNSVTLFSRATAASRGNWFALNQLGLAYGDNGQNDRAISFYIESLRLRPAYPEAWNNLGHTYDKLGRDGEAVACYREALRIRPDFAEAWYNTGVTSEKLGRSEEAMACYREAVRLRPAHALAWYNLGGLVARLGRLPEAIGYFREAARLRPDYAPARYNLGLACARLGRLDEAIGHFRDAVRLQPDHADALYNLGVVEGRLGRFPEAIGHFRDAVRVRPDFAGGWQGLGLAYEKTGNPRDAADCFLKAEQIRKKQGNL